MPTKPTYFRCGKAALHHLRERDPALGAAIDVIGPVRREVTPDLHAALIGQIISQQISTKAAVTIRNRLVETLGTLTAETVARADPGVIQQCGMSHKKAAHIQEFSRGVLEGKVDLEALRSLSDAEVCSRLSAVKGIGVWTAEMLMTFSMQRPDIISWGDLAIHRGLRMLYRHRWITRELFAKYRRRYTPHASAASLYLWAIAGGAIPELTDPAPRQSAGKKSPPGRRGKPLPKNGDAS